MSETKVRLQIDGSHAAITFFSEGGVNVLSSAVVRSLRELIGQVAADRRIRTTVFQAEGKVFLAGADIKEMAGFDAAAARAYGELGSGTFDELAALPSVTVAAINGPALGGGLELALACDFRIAVKSAKVGLPETSLGLIPGWGGIGRLTTLVGPSRAKRLFYSALPVSAEEGLSFGLVDEIVNSAEDLESRLPAFCKSFKRGAPAAVALAKRVFREGDGVSGFVDCFDTDDCREGIAAFVEKRLAAWME